MIETQRKNYLIDFVNDIRLFNKLAGELAGGDIYKGTLVWHFPFYHFSVLYMYITCEKHVLS